MNHSKFEERMDERGTMSLGHRAWCTHRRQNGEQVESPFTRGISLLYVHRLPPPFPPFSFWIYPLGEHPRDWLTDYVEEPCLVFHGVGVYLAHVKSSVRFPDIAYVQSPGATVINRYRYPVVLRYNVVCYRQDCLCVDAEPGDLKKKKMKRKKETSF